MHVWLDTLVITAMQKLTLFEDNKFFPFCERIFRPRHIMSMLKLRLLTTERYTNVFDHHDTLQTCWNWHVWPRHITAMLKRTFLKTIHSTHAETDLYDHDILQTVTQCLNKTDMFFMSKLNFLTTLCPCCKWLLRPRHIPTLQKWTFFYVNILCPCWNWYIPVMLKM